MKLVGDVGGTKTLLALVDSTGKLQQQHRYEAADFTGFDDLLAAYLGDEGIAPADISGGCLGVAGPVADDGASAQLTNLPWRISADALLTAGGSRLQLVNDFAAAALGAVTAGTADLFRLQAGEPLADAPRLVVGAGTGLGMAIVLRDHDRWRVVPGEGGHVAFGPADERQTALLAFLARRHGRVTWERVVSGPGLVAIHEFLGGDPLTAERITELATADPASPAADALRIFLAAYGAFAGDMALACLARGGVFLAGGIAGRLLHLLPGSGFLPAFNAKAEHAALAARMPVVVATDPLLGLRGAAIFATNDS